MELTHTIVLIDDNPLLTKAYSQALEHRGFRVQVAHEGPKGIALITDTKPDAVLLDLRIHTMDGLTVLKTIKETPDIQHIPVIIFTMSSNPDDEKEARAGGAAGYFHKDETSISDLIDAILSVITN